MGGAGCRLQPRSSGRACVPMPTYHAPTLIVCACRGDVLQAALREQRESAARLQEELEAARQGLQEQVGGLVGGWLLA